MYPTGDDEAHCLKLVVDKLREARNPKQRYMLQLLNALVSGPNWEQGDIAMRVQMRDVLMNLEFLELTRALLTTRGDEIDIQIAIFDQEMRADSAQLQGKKAAMPVDLDDAAPADRDAEGQQAAK